MNIRIALILATSTLAMISCRKHRANDVFQNLEGTWNITAYVVDGNELINDSTSIHVIFGDMNFVGEATIGRCSDDISESCIITIGTEIDSSAHMHLTVCKSPRNEQEASLHVMSGSSNTQQYFDGKQLLESTVDFPDDNTAVFTGSNGEIRMVRVE